MAANTNNRIPVKWVRDRAKAAYDKKLNCYICNTSQELELHHTHSITLLLNAWATRKDYDISTDAGILAVRDDFIADYHKEIYLDVYTLCRNHHIKLHGIYGKAPSLASALKQNNWIEIQKSKTAGTSIATAAGNFGRFY